MDTATQVQESWWEATKHFEFKVGVTPFTQPWFIAMSMILYLAGLYFGTKYMENRPAYKLRMFTAIHNFILCGLSFVMAAGMLYEVWIRPIPEEAHRSWAKYAVCAPRGSPMVGRLYWWCYVYHLSKWYELIDSFIIVLKKSQKGLTFLHVLHHSGMMMMVVSWFAANFNTVWFPCAFNSIVHVVMYLYYGMSSLGHRWRLRHYITTFQLVQFSSGAVYFALYIPGRLFFGTDCSGNLFIMSIGCLVDLYFFYLFYDFYQTEYKLKKKLASQAAARQAASLAEQGQASPVPPSPSVFASPLMSPSPHIAPM
ncbi:fatty acid elongase [Monocercomonoides exilis]|uniref:fatty acid elongase n=1 Tax=Monocercomonoides exilis TaxID=2049356 RepID=UPI003559CE3B|nr:fatty acid elongase [Monocercomonoides exilis]|eukprot:MONOS_10731.1-p1 / transcript=MONOS_10731.1 / gene=MONOS_10731 / organism=Monocercomonoides_exilis_PA203 / gene_product=fatty acid elongase / transcript_product=fatty acid elongase / location=Mono_scaffold00499:10450-11767(-) / protein_length=310 / sequence_SO=supercontig / SO=protein_coding / is_pseudo=false